MQSKKSRNSWLKAQSFFSGLARQTAAKKNRRPLLQLLHQNLFLGNFPSKNLENHFRRRTTPLLRETFSKYSVKNRSSRESTRRRTACPQKTAVF
jgi:hypothetical protein